MTTATHNELYTAVADNRFAKSFGEIYLVDKAKSWVDFIKSGYKATSSRTRLANNYQEDGMYTSGCGGETGTFCIDRDETEVYWEESPELKNTINNLTHYYLLKEGWDGYDGVKPALSEIMTAISFVHLLSEENLEIPKSMLSSDGSIGLYWEVNSTFVDVSFEGKNKLSYYAEHDNDMTGEDDLSFEGGLPEKLRSIIMSI